MRSGIWLGLGKELRRLRIERGLTLDGLLQHVQDRLPINSPLAYWDEKTLRNIEKGLIRPKRQKLIALIVLGLGLKRVAGIDHLLRLVPYVGLDDTDIRSWGLTRDPEETLPQLPAVVLRSGFPKSKVVSGVTLIPV